MSDDFSEFDFVEVDAGLGRRGRQRAAARRRDGGPGPAPTRRWPWVLAVSTAVVLGLVGVIVLTGGDDTPTALTPASTAPPTTGATTTPAYTTGPGSTAPATTPPPRPTVPTLPPRLTAPFTPVSVAFPALPAPTRTQLVLVLADQILDVDVDERTVLSRARGTDLTDEGGLAIAGPDWLLVQGWSGETWRYTRDEAPTRLERPDGGGRIFAGPGELVWWADWSSGELTLVDQTGTAVQDPLPLGLAQPVGVDGRGGLLLQGVGGTYLATAGEISRVTTGLVVAAGPGVFVVAECADTLACTRAVVDRRTGEHRGLPGRYTAANGMVGTVAPDGRFAVLPLPAGGSFELLDLWTGASTPLGFPSLDLGTAWSPDGRFVFMVDFEGVLVIDVQDPTATYHLDLGEVPVSGLAARPAD